MYILIRGNTLEAVEKGHTSPGPGLLCLAVVCPRGSCRSLLGLFSRLDIYSNNYSNRYIR